LISLGVDRGTVARALSGNPAAGVAAVIRAPVSGIIVEKQVTPGQLLQAGSTAAFTVANLSRVWVLAQISSSDLAAVGVHDAATIDPGNGTGPFHGIVDNVSASVDPNTRAVVARIVTPNPGDLLKKQMYVHVSIELGRVSTGLLVPVSAVLHDDENLPFVYVALPDGSFARRHVTLGYRDAQNYDVTSGLVSGDKIVSNGALFLQFMQSQ
jgi:cobalt-zinc-cadmium efflux system membrane fusion protein